MDALSPAKDSGNLRQALDESLGIAVAAAMQEDLGATIRKLEI